MSIFGNPSGRNEGGKLVLTRQDAVFEQRSDSARPWLRRTSCGAGYLWTWMRAARIWVARLLVFPSPCVCALAPWMDRNRIGAAARPRSVVTFRIGSCGSYGHSGPDTFPFTW